MFNKLILKLLEESDKNVNSYTIDGENVRNKIEMFEVFSKKLKFPNYFGKNFDALYDMLTDLSWLKKNELSINVQNFNNLSNNDLKLLKSTISNANNYWSKNNSNITISFN